jgi:hypothetical protein
VHSDIQSMSKCCEEMTTRLKVLFPVDEVIPAVCAFHVSKYLWWCYSPLSLWATQGKVCPKNLSGIPVKSLNVCVLFNMIIELCHFDLYFLHCLLSKLMDLSKLCQINVHSVSTKQNKYFTFCLY